MDSLEFDGFHGRKEEADALGALCRRVNLLELPPVPLQDSGGFRAAVATEQEAGFLGQLAVAEPHEKVARAIDQDSVEKRLWT